jgi:uncharacterized RDD family membrane protein YckC
MQRTPALTLTPAPVLLRIAALVIDAVILTVMWIPLLLIIEPDSLDREQLTQSTYAAFVVTIAVYNILFLSTMSATPGKLAMRLYVADRQGARVRPDTAILRYVVFLVGGFIGVGTIASIVLLFLDKSHRTVHDRIAGTIVLRRQEGVEAPPPDLS